MPKEQSKHSEAAQTKEKLSPGEIKQIIGKYKNIKLDAGSQHFMIERRDEKGNWVGTDMIPTWKEIPRAHSKDVEIEEELKMAGAKLKTDEPAD